MTSGAIGDTLRGCFFDVVVAGGVTGVEVAKVSVAIEIVVEARVIGNVCDECEKKEESGMPMSTNALRNAVRTVGTKENS
jgi:hypothetical protein